jgi:hypothetical protein
MTIFKILTAVFILTGLAACTNDYGQADHRPVYTLGPDTPFPQ